MTRIVCTWPVPGTTHIDDVDMFQPTDIFWHCDTLYPSSLKELFCNLGEPKFIVNDNAAKVQCEYNVFAVPFRGIELEFKQFRHCDFNLLLPETRYCFNFIINKKQINRALLIKLVEHFKLSSFDYTWSGLGANFSMQCIIDDWNLYDPDALTYNNDLRYNILSPITLPKKFVDAGQMILHSDSSYSNYGNNAWTWDNIFKDLMGNSAVSLISESVEFQRSSVFTEKTLYSILSMTFPIFIGGYGHAEQLTAMGFDDFSDVVNHDYQYKDTLFDRCYYAFKDNYQLLTDVDYVRNLRLSMHDRLKNNVQLLLSGQLIKNTNKVLDSWPTELTASIRPLWETVRETVFDD